MKREPMQRGRSRNYRAPLVDNGLTIGQRLKYLRLLQGLTQQTYADLAGCHRQVVYYLEKDFPRATNPTLDKLQRMCRALGAELTLSINLTGPPKRVRPRARANAERSVREAKGIPVGKAPRWAAKNGYYWNLGPDPEKGSE